MATSLAPASGSAPSGPAQLSKAQPSSDADDSKQSEGGGKDESDLDGQTKSAESEKPRERIPFRHLMIVYLIFTVISGVLFAMSEGWLQEN
jgi:hypothetical protein